VKNVDHPKHFNVMFNNVAQNVYPDNTIGAFKFELSQTIDLGPDDKWEEGLVNSRILWLTWARLKPQCSLARPQPEYIAI